MYVPAVMALIFSEAPTEICLGDGGGSCADPYEDAAEEEDSVGDEEEEEDELRREEEG